MSLSCAPVGRLQAVSAQANLSHSEGWIGVKGLLWAAAQTSTCLLLCRIVCLCAQAVMHCVPPTLQIMFCGVLEYYDKSYDRVTPKAPCPLRKTTRVFRSVTTSDDPIIR